MGDKRKKIRAAIMTKLKIETDGNAEREQQERREKKRIRNTKKNN